MGRIRPLRQRSLSKNSEGILLRRAKIVCTLGPAVATDAQITELIAAGMNVARLNLSHGDHQEHEARLNSVRSAAEKAKKDRKSTRLNSSHVSESRMPSSA